MGDKITDIASLLFAYNEHLFREGYADVDILSEFDLHDIYDFLDKYNIDINFQTLRS